MIIPQEPATIVGAGLLSEWEAFYVIIGTSAGALTGLQFIVITLLVEAKARDAARAISAFGTPTVVHLSSVLLIAGILSAPWREALGPAIGLGSCGIGGLIYAAITIRRIISQEGYAPVFEDWLWHVVLPVVAYSAALAAAIGLLTLPGPFLFLSAAATLVLLFAAIHNAWDTVVFIAQGRLPGAVESPGTSPP